MCLQVFGSATVYVQKVVVEKPFVAPEEAACNLMNCLQWCHSVAEMHHGKSRHQVFFLLEKNVGNKISCILGSVESILMICFFKMFIMSPAVCFQSAVMDQLFQNWHLQCPECSQQSFWTYGHLITGIPSCIEKKIFSSLGVRWLTFQEEVLFSELIEASLPEMAVSKNCI